MTTTIFVSAAGAKCTAKPNNYLVCGMKGLKAVVTLDAEFDDLNNRFLCVHCGDKDGRFQIDDSMTVTIPAEFLQHGKRFSVGIDAYNDSMTKRIPTTTALCGTVRSGTACPSDNNP